MSPRHDNSYIHIDICVLVCRHIYGGVFDVLE